jgi:nicotinamidase-related amidase
VFVHSSLLSRAAFAQTAPKAKNVVLVHGLFADGSSWSGRDRRAGSSGFANTDLDLQLKKHGIHQLIVIGLIAHTCIEATVRYAAEFGYDATVVRDATTDYSEEMMHAALDINLPSYAGAIVTTSEVVASISAANVMEPAQASS